MPYERVPKASFGTRSFLSHADRTTYKIHQMESQLLLHYAFPTQPSPLEAGVKMGRLNVVVSSQKRPHYCRRLNIYLPIGKGAEYLSASPPIATVNTTGWTIAPASAPMGPLPPALQALDVHLMAYHCLPATSENELITDDLEFRLVITGVDEAPGLFPIGIHEFVATEKDGEAISRTGTFYRRKAEPSFFLRNLVAAAASGDVDVPLGRIAAGVPFRLNWESNGTTYRVFTEGSIPLYTGSDTQFLLHAGIHADTTFVLQAEVPGGQGGGSGFETAYLYAALTVCCAYADLHVHSLTSAGPMHADGPQRARVWRQPAARAQRRPCQHQDRHLPPRWPCRAPGSGSGLF